MKSDNNLRCVVIAEVAQAHDGSLGMAHAYIDAASNAGADYIKFQTHIAEAESTKNEPWRVHFSKQDKTRYDYWQRMEFAEPQWAELRAHADEVGIGFMSSPFSMEALELLKRVGVGAWKVASGEVSNIALLNELSKSSSPVFISTGMSNIREVDQAVAMLKKGCAPLTIMQCTSKYPTPPEEVGLNVLKIYRKRYDLPVGLSDHSGSIYPSIAATALGATAVEVHVTFSREMFGPDVPVSVTLEELTELVNGVRMVEKMTGALMDKNKVAEQLEPMRRIFKKSIVAKRDLHVGDILDLTMITYKKPGIGLPVDYAENICGCKVIRPIERDQMIDLSDLDCENNGASNSTLEK